MRGKLAVLIALVIVAALSISGCASTTNTTSTTPTTHDVVLEKFVTAYKGFVADVRGSGNGTITAWQVTWPNATTANIQATARYTQPNVTVTYNRTVISFASTDAATAYLRSYNLTGHTLSNTTTERGNVSATALGHPLTVLTVYGKISGDFRTTFEVEQADNLIIVTDSTVTSTSS